MGEKPWCEYRKLMGVYSAVGTAQSVVCARHLKLCFLWDIQAGVGTGDCNTASC